MSCIKDSAVINPCSTCPPEPCTSCNEVPCSNCEDSLQANCVFTTKDLKCTNGTLTITQGNVEAVLTNYLCIIERQQAQINLLLTNLNLTCDIPTITGIVGD